MKILNLSFFLALFTSYLISAQDYIDLVKVNYGSISDVKYNDNSASTAINILDASLTFPLKLNDKTAIITGLDYSQHQLNLLPESSSIVLNNLTLKAGLNIKHNERWSGTYVLLPKISSQDFNTESNHFFFGGLALLKFQKTLRKQYRIGVYASTEGFGVLATPVLGIYYLSETKKWEATANLPINADINYKLGQTTALGLGFQAPVRSYGLKTSDASSRKMYLQMSNIEIGPYFQYSFLNNQLLFRCQGGYSTTSYEAFNEGDTLPFRLSAFEFGDGRNLLNPELEGGFFLRGGLIYRYHLKKNK